MFLFFSFSHICLFFILEFFKFLKFQKLQFFFNELRFNYKILHNKIKNYKKKNDFKENKVFSEENKKRNIRKYQRKMNLKIILEKQKEAKRNLKKGKR